MQIQSALASPSASPSPSASASALRRQNTRTCCCAFSLWRPLGRQRPETLHKLGLSLANLCLMSVARNEVVSRGNIIPPLYEVGSQSWSCGSDTGSGSGLGSGSLSHNIRFDFSLIFMAGRLSPQRRWLVNWTCSDMPRVFFENFSLFYIWLCLLSFFCACSLCILLIIANFPCGPALGAHIDINCVLLVQFLLVAQLHSLPSARCMCTASLTNVAQLICFNSIIALIFYRIKALGLLGRSLASCRPHHGSFTSKEDARHSWRPTAGSSHS